MPYVPPAWPFRELLPPNRVTERALFEKSLAHVAALSIRQNRVCCAQCSRQVFPALDESEFPSLGRSLAPTPRHGAGLALVGWPAGFRALAVVLPSAPSNCRNAFPRPWLGLHAAQQKSPSRPGYGS